LHVKKRASLSCRTTINGYAERFRRPKHRQNAAGNDAQLPAVGGR
jgi:hypothetical protein